MKASQIFVISVAETSMLPWIYLLDLEIVCDEINIYIYIMKAIKHRPSYRLSTRQGSTSKAEPWTSCQTSQKRDVAGKSFLNSPHRRMPYRTINQVDRISCQHLGSWRLEQLSPKICSAMRVNIVRHIFGTCHTLKRKYPLTPLMAALRRDETSHNDPIG